MAQEQTSIAEQILAAAQRAELGKMEELWINHIAQLPTQPVFFRDWLKLMKKHQAEAKAEELLALLINNRLDSNKWRGAMRVLLATIPAYPESEPLRPQLVRAIRGFYSDIPMLEEILMISGLEGNAKLPEGFTTFRDLMHLTPGMVYQHYDWGIGVIQELDLGTKKVMLAFNGNSPREMTIDGVRKFLKFIEPTHFVARKAKDPASLLKIGDSDPAALIKEALGSQADRQMKQAELKALLTDGLIAPEDWNSWWAKAREALKLDPYVDFEASAGARAVIRLRDKPRTFEEEVQDRFFASDSDTALKAELIRQLAKRSKEQILPKDIVERIARQLEADWKLAPEERIVQRLEIAYMLKDLAEAAPGIQIAVPDVHALIAEIEDYQKLVEIDNVDYGIRALSELLRRDGEEGSRKAAALLPRAPVKLAQAIWRALEEQEQLDLAVNALQQVIDQPLLNPETFTWAMRAVLDGSWAHLSEFFPISAVVPDLLSELEQWQRVASEPARRDQAAAAKSLLSKMRTLLQADKFDALCRAVQGMSKDAANRMRRTIQSNTALPDVFKSQSDRYILLTRRDLEEAQEPTPETELHVCTQRAYNEKAAELREIASTKIPKNSRVIEDARMEGDLRENAGYQYAKEEQKMLLQQQATLTDMLQRAVIIEPRDVDASKIGFGTKFRARNLNTGEEEAFTLMGRWEANAEKNILSQQAPLAQQFSGHRQGDTVKIQHPGGGTSEYEILEIINALTTEEWSPKTPAAV